MNTKPQHQHESDKTNPDYFVYGYEGGCSTRDVYYSQDPAYPGGRITIRFGVGPDYQCIASVRDSLTSRYDRGDIATGFKEAAQHLLKLNIIEVTSNTPQALLNWHKTIID